MWKNVSSNNGICRREIRWVSQGRLHQSIHYFQGFTCLRNNEFKVAPLAEVSLSASQWQHHYLVSKLVTASERVWTEWQEEDSGGNPPSAHSLWLAGTGSRANRDGNIICFSDLFFPCRPCQTPSCVSLISTSIHPAALSCLRLFPSAVQRLLCRVRPLASG